MAIMAIADCRQMQKQSSSLRTERMNKHWGSPAQPSRNEAPQAEAESSVHPVALNPPGLAADPARHRPEAPPRIPVRPEGSGAARIVAGLFRLASCEWLVG